MPKIVPATVPQRVTIGHTRPAGDVDDGLAEVKLNNSPSRMVAFVGDSSVETQPLMLLEGDMFGGVRFRLPPGRGPYRFRSVSGEERAWDSQLRYRPTSNMRRLLGILDIAQGMPVDEARGRLRSALGRGWREEDVADVRAMLDVLTRPPYMDESRPAAMPPTDSFVSFSVETPIEWTSMRSVSGPTTSTTASTTAPPAHRSVPRTDGLGNGGAYDPGPDGPPPATEPTMAAQPSSLTIVGMPPGGATYIDGVRIDDALSLPLSRVEGGTIFWVVPASPGSHSLRVVPPEGESLARTRTVEVPPHGTTMFRFSEMAQTAPTVTGTTIRRNVPDAPPTLRINGMPPHGTVEMDGARTDDSHSRWIEATGSAPSAWIVPAAPGRHVFRATPPTGAARTATVTIPSTGEASVSFSEMTPEAAPRPTILVVSGMPSGGTISVNGTALDMSTGMWGDGGAWAMPAQPGQANIVIAPPASSGAPSRRTDVMISPSATTTIAFSTMTEVPGTGTQEPPKPPNATPDTKHDTEREASDEESKKMAEERHATDTTTPDATVVSTGRVVVRTALSNVAGMVQRVDGSAVASGTMTRGTDGALAASVAPGSYQLVVWQQAEFPSIARTNVRTAPVTVIVGADSVFSYTGTALTALTASMTSGTHADVVTQRLRDLLAAGGSVDFALLHFGELSR